MILRYGFQYGHTKKPWYETKVECVNRMDSEQRDLFSKNKLQIETY